MKINLKNISVIGLSKQFLLRWRFQNSKDVVGNIQVHFIVQFLTVLFVLYFIKI